MGWAALTILLISGCGERAPVDPSIEVSGAWVRSVRAEGTSPVNTAAYMRILNRGDVPDRLLEVRSDAARKTELHRTTIDESGLASMGPAGSVEIPAGEAILLEPGGLHVMLMGVEETLGEGEMVRLTLAFEIAGELSIETEARPY
jgi:copper(I)-binding protein